MSEDQQRQRRELIAQAVRQARVCTSEESGGIVWERDCDYLQAQIEQAEADGISEFDAEKFKPKKKREAN